MIPDITPPVGVWTNVYQATGFAVGSALTIQNKGGGKAMVWEGETPPPGNTEALASGTELTNRGQSCKVQSGVSGCWVICWETSFKTNGRLCVQEIPS